IFVALLRTGFAAATGYVPSASVAALPDGGEKERQSPERRRDFSERISASARRSTASDSNLMGAEKVVVGLLQGGKILKLGRQVYRGLGIRRKAGRRLDGGIPVRR